MNQNIGFRIFPNIKRPSKELVEKFRGIPSSNIGDNLNRMYCMNHKIRPYNNIRLLGTAFTVKAPMGDNLVLNKALDLAQPGDIIVVDGQGALDRSLMGEMMVTYAVGRGISGFVLDAAIRDVDSISQALIPVYAAGVTPQGPYKNGPGEINVAISCGGQVVFPGDIIVGDADGIVIIRPEYAEELAKISREKLNDETKRLEQMKQGKLDVDGHILRFNKIFDTSKVQIVENIL